MKKRKFLQIRNKSYPIRKIFKIMKLSMIFLLVSTLAFSANLHSQNVKVTLKPGELSFSELFNEIESQTEFKFAFSISKLDPSQKVKVDMDKKTVAEVLNKTLPEGISYEIVYPYIIIVNADEKNSASVIQQQKSVSGKVTDTNNQPIPGVTVLVKGTLQGTVTDAEGKYSILNIPSDAVLQFSFIGMKTVEIPVGNQTTINVTLSEIVVGLEEVVVTAFGISKEAKQLTYVAQQVKGESLSATGNNDITKSLQGKIAGVTVKQLSGMPGESVSMRIRGSSSIAGNNTPLFVVDGFPVGTDVSFKIDPNEVESISVLKGAAASALYGLRASNGVILITTKKGETNEIGRPTISFNAVYSFDRLSIYPPMQKIYGQGENFVFNPNSAFSWGPRIDQMGTYTNQLGEQEEARAYDNIRDFFRTGGTMNNNLNISNRFAQGNYSIGISYNNQMGIVDYTGLNGYGFKLAGDYELSKKLIFSPSINFSESKADQVTQGAGNSSLFYAAFNAPPSYNLKGKPTHVPGNEYQQINFRGSHDNIYWARKHNKVINEFTSFIGSVGLKYKLTNWMDLNYRIGINQNSSSSNEIFELGSGETNGRTTPPSGGSIYESLYRSRDINSNFNLIVKKKIANILDIDFLLGHEFYDMSNKRLSSYGRDLVIGGFHSLTNCSTVTSNQTIYTQRSYGIYGNLNIGYKDILFLNSSVRNDVLSNMPRTNRSFIYPSIGLGFIFTELLKEKSILSFGKLRVSYAEVGQAGPIYATNQVYVASNSFTFPYSGINAFMLNSSLASYNLMPQNTKTWEFGINLNLLDNRIKFDYTYFDGTSEGQILSVPVPASTGFTSEMMNAGEMSNNGHEVMLSLTLIKNKNITWDLSTNFSSYTNKVLKLAEGVNQLGLGGFRVGIVAEPGQEYPVIRGTGYARDPETGKIVVDSRELLPNGNANAFYGMPLKSSESSLILGKVNPDFEVNFLNSIKYKNFTLYAQVDWRQGGKVYSGSSRLSKLYGTHPETVNREVDVILDAVKGYYDAAGNLVITGDNDIPIKKGYTYFRSLLDNIAESNVYDASFIRLREVRLEYQFGSFNKKMPFKDLNLFLTGRNLWLIKSGLPYFDPEMGGSTGNYMGEEYVRYPQITSFGVGLNVKF